MDHDVREYLAPRDGFCQWSDDGTVLVYPDGRTLAFLEELTPILRALAPRGLPTLGALALLLAATRDNWDRAPFDRMTASLLGGPRGLVQEVVAQLERIHGFDRALRTSAPAKLALALIAFEGGPPAISPELSARVVATLEQGPWALAGLSEQDSQCLLDLGEVALLGELVGLADRLGAVTEESLRLRVATGLDRLPGAAELDLPDGERARSLVESLLDDKDLSAVARLARRAIAALALPRPTRAADDLPVGGASDLANRGELDRLLPSELAHDDLTLAVRLALHEAMFLRRETPPSPPEQGRAVLLDSGLRSWGAPRVFTAAVGLALVATTQRTRACLCGRAEGEEVRPVDLTTRAGLVAQLERLGVDLHCGAALPSFARLADEACATEPVVVTTADAYRDEEFQAALRAWPRPPLFVAALERDGGLRLWEWSGRGARLVRELRLPQEEFAPLRQPATPLLTPSASGLPALCEARPFPLRLSHAVDPERLWFVPGEGAFALTHDRRLMCWDRPQLGARQLACGLPGGRLRWAGALPSRRASLVLQDRETLSLVVVDTESGQIERRPLPTPTGLRGVALHRGVLLLVYHRHARGIHVESGEPAGHVEWDAPWIWGNGRFLRTTDSDCSTQLWSALSTDGLSLRLEPVPPYDMVQHRDQRGTRPPLVAMFDSHRAAGPVGITAEAGIFETVSGQQRTMSPATAGWELVPTWLGIPGFALVQSRQFSHRQFLIDLENPNWLVCHRQPPMRVYPGYLELIRPRSYRQRFTHLGSDDQGRVALRNGSQYFAIERVSGQWMLRPLSRLEFREAAPFRPLDGLDLGYKLSRAGGTGWSAWLDSRGLLHLRADDVSLPELSIVLTQGALAGWCSDQGCWGPAYYHAASNPMGLDVVGRTLRRYGDLLCPAAKT